MNFTMYTPNIMHLVKDIMVPEVGVVMEIVVEIEQGYHRSF